MTLSTDVASGDPGHAGLHNAERAAINGKPDNFLELDDTPSAYTGTAGHYLQVNDAADAVEFAASVLRPLSEQTASYTLVLGDAGKAVEMDVASANDVTVPPNSSVAFPVGTVIHICQVGAGQTTVVEGAGVTVDTPLTLALSGQWSTAELRKRGTDLWVLSGDLEEAVP